MPRRYGSGVGILEDRPGSVGLELRRKAPAADLPDRYTLRERDGKKVLVCREAPGLALHLDRRHSFSEPEARKLPERSILLDGAGSFGPLVDDAAHLYNLDHHEGCLRAFTLSTCEQALVLVMKGLELDVGDWILYANEPDLDTLFAIWVLFNHRRLREMGPEHRDRIVPLLRLEGAIDANGFELAELCGLPQSRVEMEKARLDELHAMELDTKRSGAWTSENLFEYTCQMLLEIDSMVYQASDFDNYTSVEEEYGHVDIGQGKVAVVCRDSGGIYEVEKRLKAVWGDRLGLVVLEKEDNHYTLRRAASLAGIELRDAYDKLNLLDPAVDGRPPTKRWGGSDDIGGSPRPTGTGLTPREIGKILKLTYKRARTTQRLRNLALATAWPVFLGGLAVAAVFLVRFFGWSSATPEGEALETIAAGLGTAVVVALATRRISRGWSWLYGWRLPAGKDWLWLVPLVVAGGVVGGAWVPRDLPSDPDLLLRVIGAVTSAALASELVFRGLVHGMLVLDSPVQSVGGRWFVSRANLVAAVLFTLATVGLSFFWIARGPWQSPEVPFWVVSGLGALVTGIALGAIRERSASLWPGFVALAAAGLVRLAIGF